MQKIHLRWNCGLRDQALHSGASPRAATRLVVGGGARLAALGVAIGLAGALGVSRTLRGLLYGVGPTDARTFAAATIVLVASALCASLIPARRAARVDPAVVLRGD